MTSHFPSASPPPLSRTKSILVSPHLHNDDVLHALDGGQAMCDDDYSPARAHEVQGLLDDCCD